MKNLTLSLSVMSGKTTIQVYYRKMAINISNDLVKIYKRDRFYCDKYTNVQSHEDKLYLDLTLPCSDSGNILI